MTAQQPTQTKFETKSTASPLDTVLLVLSFAALVGGIAAFYTFTDLNQTVRVLIVLGGFGASLALAYQTQTGKTVWGFIRGANIEVRKTTWPTRQESLQATLMIAVVVLITALLLWGLDSALLWGVKSVTGRG